MVTEKQTYTKHIMYMERGKMEKSVRVMDKYNLDINR